MCLHFYLAVDLMHKLKHYALLIFLCGFIQLGHSPLAQADQLPEYQIKAAFLYNFAIYTHWPNDIGDSFNLCIYGKHSFGNTLDKLQEKKVNQRFITIKYITHINDPADCQMVFISPSPTLDIKAVLDPLKGKPILTIVDNIDPNGATINFFLVDQKIRFDVNLVIAERSGLNFSSQLLRFAREVHK